MTRHEKQSFSNYWVPKLEFGNQKKKREFGNRTWAAMLALLLLFAGCDNPKPDENTLAVVGNRVITKADFIKRYKYFRMKTGQGVPDTYEARRQVLNSYVDEQLLLIEAENRAYGEDSEGRFEHERIEIQELLNAFNRTFIANKIKVSDDELRELFVRFNTRLKARHLYAPTKAEAEALVASLQNGASFEELARTVFHDPDLRDSGGLLGDFTVDEMEPNFENAAYSLAVGEVSKPVRTSDGYSIIRVDDRITKPILTESEFAKRRAPLRSYWQRRKIKEAIEAFSDSVRKELHISFNETVVNHLFSAFKKQNQDRSLQEDPPALTILSELKNKELVNSKMGIWNVAQFQEKARFTSPKQHTWIRSKDLFKDFISGLVIRDYILAEARRANLHKHPDYLAIVDEKWDDYLYDRMIASLKNELQVAEDSLRNYYADDPQRFASPPQINLREIVLRDRSTAHIVGSKLSRGEAFAELAKDYSVRVSSAVNGGELGFLQPRDFGKWAEKVFTMKVGEHVGPIKMDSMYVFLECIAREPARIRSFEEARAEVEEALKFTYWDDTYVSRVAGFRKSVKRITVYPERLKSIRLN